MDFIGVQAFLAIVQTGNLNKAAELLNLTQSAISYRLKKLEQAMGSRLIERSKGVHKIKLTAMGENFVSLAERWNLLEQETHILQAQGPQLTLSISVADSLNIYVLPSLYRALGRHHPPIRLTIRTQHTNESFESIERKEMDMAFVVRIISSPSVHIEPFFSEEMILFRLANPNRKPMETIDIQQLAPQYELYMNWSMGYQSWHDQWWDPNCPARIHLDTAGLIPLLMYDQQQWAIMPMSVGKRLLLSGKFIIQRLSEPAPKRICYKATHKYPSKITQQNLNILDHYIELCKFKNSSKIHNDCKK